MVFKSRQKRRIFNIQISKHNQDIVHAKETNFLGVILDENLNWKSEIKHVSIFPTDRIFKDLGILKCDDIHLLQLGQFMFSCKISFLPPRFNNSF